MTRFLFCGAVFLSACVQLKTTLDIEIDKTDTVLDCLAKNDECIDFAEAADQTSDLDLIAERMAKFHECVAERNVICDMAYDALHAVKRQNADASVDGKPAR